MILNNKGWGITELLISGAIILFLLLLSAYYIHRLYKTIDKPLVSASSETVLFDNVDYYNDYERDFSSAASRYVNYNNIYLPSTGYTIYMSELVNEGYIDRLYERKDHTKCDGYVFIKNGNYNPYIRCSNYVTEGY